APLRLLRDIRCEHAWHLEPGDVRYLAACAAHDGNAVEHCLTASIGIRAPDAQELGLRFLEFLQDELALEGTYADPDLVPPRHPARIGDDMLRKVHRILSRVSWTGDDIERFLGRHLTVPGPLIRFAPPRKPLALR